MSDTKLSVLFVCLGNICRSPSAQMVFEAMLEQKGMQERITVDSCGTAAYHIGKKADARSRAAAQKRNYKSDHLRARQLCQDDFQDFDYILAMDKDNLADIESVKPAGAKAKVFLFMDFHSEASVEEVPDPYYGGEQGFEHVLDLIEHASEKFYDFLGKQHPGLVS